METINWYEFDENKKSDLASLNFISNIKEKKDFINSIKEHQKWFKQYYEKNKPKSDEEFLTYFCNTYFTCPHCKYKNNCKRNDPHYPMAKNPFMSSPNPAPSCCEFSPIPASSPFNYEYWKTHNKNNHLVKMQHTFNTELYDVLHEPISSFKTIEVVTRKADFAKNHILPRDFIGLTIDGKSDYTYYVSKEDFYYDKYRNSDGSLKWFYRMFQVRDKIDHHIQLYTLNFEMFDGTIYGQIGDVMKRLNNDYVKADRTIYSEEDNPSALAEWNFKFNVDDVKIRKRVIVPYEIQGRSETWEKTKEGKFRDTYPSNFWDDISVPFWSMPENTEHPTQKSEKLIAKLILASSNKDSIVFDPFLGSGTTSVTAKKLGRNYLGIEQEDKYCALAEKRLAMADTDKVIQGYADGVFWERNTTEYQKRYNKWEKQ